MGLKDITIRILKIVFATCKKFDLTTKLSTSSLAHGTVCLRPVWTIPTTGMQLTAHVNATPKSAQQTDFGTAFVASVFAEESLKS
jgi:hypothetical protein